MTPRKDQYPDVSNAVKDLDEDELTRFKIVSGGQTRSTIFVSESGLYSLTRREFSLSQHFSSNLPLKVKLEYFIKNLYL